MFRAFALTAGLVLLIVSTAWTDDIRLDARSSRLVEEPTPDWPQWRGPNRDNVSPDRGLLKAWPKDGPPLAWKATDLGIGFSTVAVAGDSVFVTGDVGTETFLFALSREGGAKRWSVKLGDIPRVDHPGARSTPTVDGDRVYALTQTGDLRCLRVRDGAEVWHKNLVTDFAGRVPAWGYGESLLIDGDKLVCTPGGKSALVALDKRTGNVVWQSDLADRAAHCSAVVSMAGGVRQYVQIVNGGVVGLDARDGKLLWKYEKLANNTANGVTPVILGDRVFCTSGYVKGGALLTLTATDGKFTATEEYYDVKLKNRLGGVVRVGDYIFGDLDGNGQPWCLEWRTGKLQANWLKNIPARQGKGSISLTYADGHLYLRYDNGYVALVAATPDGYRETGCFKIPNSTTTSYPHPVVIGGRLYLREKETLWVYDVRARVTSIPAAPPCETIPTLVYSLNLLESRPAHPPVVTFFIPARRVAMFRLFPLAAGLTLLAALVPCAPADDAKRTDWPTYHGPNHDNLSPDKGLLKEWTKDGPPLAWKATGLGDADANAYSSVAVVGDKVFTLGDTKTDTVLYAVSRDKGANLWSVKLGPLPKDYDHSGARSTPTVDGERVYALGAIGDLVCVSAKDGSEVWRKNLEKDFGGKANHWKYAESPLIDGDKLVCTPGGKNAIVALDKKTGDVIWKSDLNEKAGYASIVISNACGVRQYVQLLGDGVASVDAKDGKLLWKYDKWPGNTANCPSPLAFGDQIFCAAGYGKGGGALLALSAADGKVTEKEEYYNEKLKNKHGGVIHVGDYIYGDSDDSGHPWCVEWKTGKVVKDWLKNAKTDGRGSACMTYADGNLYLHYDNGVVALVPATADGYKEKGSFKIPGSDKWSWSHPVVIDGRLYVRDHDNLWVYDVKAK